jgi:hypothetical protein
VFVTGRLDAGPCRSIARFAGRYVMSSVDATASGVPYPVIAVGDVAPVSLDEFIGDVVFVVVKSGAQSRVHGVGYLHEGAVRFQEKAGDGGKDVRTWHIRQDGDGTFTAESATTF